MNTSSTRYRTSPETKVRIRSDRHSVRNTQPVIRPSPFHTFVAHSRSVTARGNALAPRLTQSGESTRSPGRTFATVRDMALQARERFLLADRMVASFEHDPARWTQARTHLLFQQFDLPLPFDGQFESRTEAAARILGESDDDTLMGMAAIVLELPDESVRELAANGEDTGLWHADRVRVFLSHSAVEREYAGEVSRELAEYGIHGFVAHDSIEEEKSWQPQIEVALRTAEAFVALVHPQFNDSAWCQQEVGWARGRALASYFIRLGADPRGFPSATQWPSRVGRSASEVALAIVNWIERQGIASIAITDALIDALGEARNYYEAEAAAKRVVDFGVLPDAAWDKLESIYWSNDQVCRGILANRTLGPFFEAHGRTFPPAPGHPVPE